MKRVSGYCAIVLTAVLGLGTPLAQAGDQTPRQVVSQSVEDLMSRLDNRQQYYRDNPAALEQVIRENVTPIIDWRYASASVMGKYFRNATPEQRSRFMDVFRQTLIDTYAQGLVSFDYQDVRVLDNNQDRRYEDQASVDMEVVASDGQRYPVAYTLRQSDGEWKVVNVVVNGINLGLTFRNQFDQAMRDQNRDIDAVINGWAPDVDLEEDGGNR